MVGAIHRPNSVDELSQIVRVAKQLRIFGSGDEIPASLEAQSEDVILSQLKGIEAYSRADQVMTVRAGTSMEFLSEILGKDQFSIPNSSSTSVGGAISVGSLSDESDSLSWRDCVLGLTVVLADGRIVRFGSRCVKNVAGYDGHKLFIGARGTLGIITETHLRLTPTRVGTRQTVTEVQPQIEITDPTIIKYMRRAKDLFDPSHKLNPGEMGIF